MTDREAADAVIEQWNGKFYPGAENGIPLQVRFADTPMQKSTSSCDMHLHIRIEECYCSSSQLASQRVQLSYSRSASKPFYPTLLRRTIRSRKYGLSCCSTLCKWRELATRDIQWLCYRKRSRTSPWSSLAIGLDSIYQMKGF
jgi:hypothetical protein